MSVSYDYYKVFCRVVEYGNITAAANELFLSQSTVSRTIQNLEQALGCKLLSRSTKGVELTEEGDLLYRHLKGVFEQIHKAEEQLYHMCRRKKSVLRIGASELTLEFYLVPFLDEFKSNYPDVFIQTSYSNPSIAVTDLNTGLLDLAVLASPVVYDEGIKVVQLKEIDYVLAAGPQFHDLRYQTNDLRDLMDYPFISMEKGKSVRMYAERMFASIDVQKDPKYEVGSMPLLISMIKRNFGLGFLPKLHIQDLLEEHSVFQVPLAQAIPTEHICLLVRKSVSRESVEKKFIKILAMNSTI